MKSLRKTPGVRRGYARKISAAFCVHSSAYSALKSKEFDRGTPPPPDEWEEMKEEAKQNFMSQ